MASDGPRQTVVASAYDSGKVLFTMAVCAGSPNEHGNTGVQNVIVAWVQPAPPHS